MQLTDTQRSAIAHRDGHLQLIACAGSGKTEVVARRVVELLRPQARDRLVPANIVAFTFTEKAAAELKDRIHSRVQEALGPIPGMAEMFVGTIHGFCKQLLNDEIPAFLKFDVLNEVQQHLFIDRYSQQSGLARSVDLQGKQLRRYIDTGRYHGALDLLRQADVRPEALEGNTVAAGLPLYRQLLEQKRYLDFTAIMEHAVTALETHPAMRARLAARVKHVIVDEYQDVNPIQEKVVAALGRLGAWLCVVGDDDQTIYQWNGADVRNILTFAERYPHVTTVRLEENFRSSNTIVGIARDFIVQNQKRLPKEMKGTDAQPSEVGDVQCLGFANPEAEAEHIVKTLQSLHGIAFDDKGTPRGLCWSDCAILLRSGLRKNAALLVKALTAVGIPYVIQGMNTLFDTREANAARALFYFMVDRLQTDATALENAWRLADLGLTDDDLTRFMAFAAERKERLHDDELQRHPVYNLQTLFLDALEVAGLREERVPAGRGEVVFYNLGQFSQLISDFETIHYHSKPLDKYESFGGFLEHSAQDEYSEGLQKNAHANPDAVRILTVHKAKGLEWPVVFLPGLLRNRFPMGGIGGPSVWHLLPEAAIVDAPRYRGSPEDERRLFYVALTRAQKFLFVSWAPVPNNNRAKYPSEYVEFLHGSKHVKRFPTSLDARPRAAPVPRAGVANVTLSFSELKYFFECPYQFKLRVLYGFNAPLSEALGYGKSLHNALAEVHKRALDGLPSSVADVPALLDTHLHLPYAYPAMKDTLREAGAKVLSGYLLQNQKLLAQVEFAEKAISLSLGNGVSVAGRIDLVYRRDTDETSIVDFKSTARAQDEAVTETQLHIYALGYRELTARSADYVEIWELDEQRKKPRAVDDDFLQAVTQEIQKAASALRRNQLPVAPETTRCSQCDHCRMCSAGAALVPQTATA